GAGAEELLARAGDDQRIDGAVGFKVPDQLGQRGQAVGRPSVGRWVVQRDDGGVAALVQLQSGVGIAHRMVSVALSCSMRRAMITRMISFVPSRIWCTRASR